MRDLSSFRRLIYLSPSSFVFLFVIFWDKVSLCSLVDVLAATTLGLGLGFSWSELAPWKDSCNCQSLSDLGLKESCIGVPRSCALTSVTGIQPHPSAARPRQGPASPSVLHIHFVCVCVWKEVSTDRLVAVALAVILWIQLRLVSLVLLPGSTATRFETFMVCAFKGM